MKKLRIAVTGGSGKIGVHVVRELVRRGNKVWNLDRRQAHKPDAPFVYVDLAKREQVQRAFEGMDAVCHLGEIPNPGGFSPEHVYLTNTRIGSTVLQTAADLRIPHVIYTSTCQVYGAWGSPPLAPEYFPLTEAHPRRPNNAYGLSKAANERFAELAARDSGVRVSIFRFPYVQDWDFNPADEGERQWLESATGRLNDLGTYVHISDAAHAFALAVEKPRPGCEAYHFSAPEIISAVPVADRLRVHHAGYPAPPKGWPAFGSPLDCTKARQHFGWIAKYNVLDIYRKHCGHEPRGTVAPAITAARKQRSRKRG